jgi:Ca2+-binding RTX toxin-like protein
VLSNLPYTLGANLERLILTGFAAINGVGNALNNTLTGNGAANSLFGVAGNDTLTGALGNDLLVGGAGFDRLTSGSPNDADIIQFNAISDRSDTFTDFDRIDNGAVAGDDRDRIQVSNAGFNPTGGASDLVNGVLPAARFVNGTASLGVSAGFRYFPGQGLLFFDSNGGTYDPGVGSLLLATLTNLPTFASIAGSISVI